MPKACLAVFLLLLVAFYALSDAPLSKQVEELEKLWEEEILQADKLISAEEFLSGKYSQAFWYKAMSLTHNKGWREKYLALIKDGTIFDQIHSLPIEHQRFVYAGYLSWYSPHRAKRLARTPTEVLAVNGNSQKYAVRVLGIVENQGYISKLNSQSLPPGFYELSVEDFLKHGSSFIIDSAGVGFVVSTYRPDLNYVVLEKGLLLPPALWLVALHHEERHSFDDIVMLGNKFSGRKPTLSLEVKGWAASLYTWKLFREEFMKSWRDSGLDDDPRFVTAKVLLARWLLIELLFDEYLAGNKSGFEEYIRELLE